MIAVQVRDKDMADSMAFDAVGTQLELRTFTTVYEKEIGLYRQDMGCQMPAKSRLSRTDAKRYKGKIHYGLLSRFRVRIQVALQRFHHHKVDRFINRGNDSQNGVQARDLYQVLNAFALQACQDETAI